MQFRGYQENAIHGDATRAAVMISCLEFRSIEVLLVSHGFTTHNCPELDFVCAADTGFTPWS